MSPRGRSHTIFAWVLVAAYAGLIFWLSNQPTLPVPPLFDHQDKVMHFGAYFIFAVLLAHAVYPGSLKQRFWWALVIASLYGISDEFHQSFVPGREVSFWDWTADTIGAWFGALTYLRAVQRRLRGAKTLGRGP